MARKYKRLRYEDRQVIEKMSRAGSRVVDIAATLGVHRDTIYKEYARCGATPDTYSAELKCFFVAPFLFFIILLPPAQRMKPRALGKERGNMKEWAEWFYKSKEWAQTRDAYMVAQHYLCERCGEPAKIVHHKIWLTPKNIHEQSITLCWDNLEALCQDCHNKEHHAKNVRAKRYAFTADGELIPPIQKNIFHSR